MSRVRFDRVKLQLALHDEKQLDDGYACRMAKRRCH